VILQEHSPNDAVSSGSDNLHTAPSNAGSQEPRFNYHNVPEADRSKLQNFAQQIKKSVGGHLEAGVGAGNDLKESKKIVPRGRWVEWLRSEFRWSERTATNYMRLAECFAGQTAKFADLGLCTAYELIRAPDEVRKELFARAERGETITDLEVWAQIGDGKDAARKPAPKAKSAKPGETKRAKEETPQTRRSLNDSAMISEPATTKGEAPSAPGKLLAEVMAEEPLQTSRSIDGSAVSEPTMTEGEMPLAPGKPLAEEVAESLSVFASLAVRYRDGCDPADVAKKLLTCGSQQQLENIREFFDFIQQVERVLFPDEN